MSAASQEDRDLAGSRRAIIRAARRAAELARQHNQPVLLWRDGKVVEVMPDDLPPLPDEAPMRRSSSESPGTGTVQGELQRGKT